MVGGGMASADYAPQPGDVVGVGGDTPQYALEFGADGDTQGDAGFNATGDVNRLVTFNATADGNARSAYTNNATTGANSVALNPTDVLRAGTAPVQRVQSSGAAITALLADKTLPGRSSTSSSAPACPRRPSRPRRPTKAGASSTSSSSGPTRSASP
jgi:hypothetical protein